MRDAVVHLRGVAPEDGRLHVVGAAVREIAPLSDHGACACACAWVQGWEKRKLTDDERSDRRRFVETLCHIEPAIAAARGLALRFMGLVRHHDLDGFDRCLPQACACAVPELQRFAAGLEADLSAVRAAFN